MTNVANKIRTEVLSVHDMYLLSTFRLPPKQGGALFGLHYKKDNSRWFEVSVVGKTNKEFQPVRRTQPHAPPAGQWPEGQQPVLGTVCGLPAAGLP
ncbi:hypothetical protein E2320_013997 [Naja naja]|nr:hypothetical protein E2320_013997 [Naja naja]